ncbi:hypothetical protein K474DRAFT_1655750 [Panus rudis PR-1116 ss-1]|nr:hypothetical protein K474DRAFT_1655750 [Panus rudis PR-1116 ss-1]
MTTFHNLRLSLGQVNVIFLSLLVAINLKMPGITHNSSYSFNGQPHHRTMQTVPKDGHRSNSRHSPVVDVAEYQPSLPHLQRALPIPESRQRSHLSPTQSHGVVRPFENSPSHPTPVHVNIPRAGTRAMQTAQKQDLSRNLQLQDSVRQDSTSSTADSTIFGSRKTSMDSDSQSQSSTSSEASAGVQKLGRRPVLTIITDLPDPSSLGRNEVRNKGRSGTKDRHVRCMSESPSNSYDDDEKPAYWKPQAQSRGERGKRDHHGRSRPRNSPPAKRYKFPSFSRPGPQEVQSVTRSRYYDSPRWANNPNGKPQWTIDGPTRDLPRIPEAKSPSSGCFGRWFLCS